MKHLFIHWPFNILWHAILPMIYNILMRPCKAGRLTLAGKVSYIYVDDI